MLRRWLCYKAVSEGTEHTDEHGVEYGCSVGRALRDDVAMDMMAKSLQSLQMDVKSIVSNVTALAYEAIQAGDQGIADDPERLKFEIEGFEKKKEMVMDSYFSGDLTKDEMERMKSKYEDQIVNLKKRLKTAEERQKGEQSNQHLQKEIKQEVTDLLSGTTASDIFYRTILDQITVYKERDLELRFNNLPQVFRFAG